LPRLNSSRRYGAGEQRGYDRFTEALSILRWVLVPWWRATQWLLARPHLVRPETIFFAAGGLFVAGWAVVAYEPLGFLFIPPALIAATAGAAAINAQRLRRRSDRPVLYVSRFATASGLATSTAANHQAALVERLVDEGLNEQFEIRQIKAPMSQRSALALVASPPGSAAAFGKLRAEANVALFDGRIAIRWTTWPRYGEPLTPVFEYSAVGSLKPPLSIPTNVELQRDANVPLTRLVSNTFDVEHADALASVLLIEAAGATVSEALDRMPDIDTTSVSQARRLLARVTALGAPLPRGVTAQKRIVEANIALAEKTHPSQVLKKLQASPGDAAEVAAYWEHLIFINEILSADPGADQRALRYAQQLVRIDESNAAYQFYVGNAYAQLGRSADALRSLDKATSLGVAAVSYHALVAKAMVYAGSNNLEPATISAREALHIFKGPDALGVLAYAQAESGRRDKGLATFRKALRLIVRRGRFSFDGNLTSFERSLSGWMTAFASLEELDASSVSPKLYAVFLRVYPSKPGAGARAAWVLGRWMFRRNPQDVALYLPLGDVALATNHPDFSAALYLLWYRVSSSVREYALATASIALSGDRLAANAYLDDLPNVVHREVRNGDFVQAPRQPSRLERAEVVLSALAWDRSARTSPNGRWLIDEIYRRYPNVEPSRDDLDAWLDSASFSSDDTDDSH
jgi:tetratricopeptide (TPR) repeat protein